MPLPKKRAGSTGMPNATGNARQQQGMPQPHAQSGMPIPNQYDGMPLPDNNQSPMPPVNRGRHSVPRNNDGYNDYNQYNSMPSSSMPQSSTYDDYPDTQGYDDTGMDDFVPQPNRDQYQDSYGGMPTAPQGNVRQRPQGREQSQYDDYGAPNMGAPSRNGMPRQQQSFQQDDYNDYQSYDNNQYAPQDGSMPPVRNDDYYSDVDPMMGDMSDFDISDDDIDYSSDVIPDDSYDMHAQSQNDDYYSEPPNNAHRETANTQGANKGSGNKPKKDMRDNLPLEPIPDAEVNHLKERSQKAVEKREREDNRATRRSRKSKSHVGEDKKKDAAAKVKTAKWCIIGVLILILCIGFYNVLMPKHEWSAAEISNVARTANGDTGFPMQEGAGIAQQFIEAYIQSDDQSNAAMLNVFYNGTTLPEVNKTGAGSAQLNNMQTPSNIKQLIKSGPYLYDEQSTSPNGDAATFRFGTLIYRVDKQNNQPIMSTKGDAPDFKWLFYQVDVHYDKKTQKFSIAKNSPTLVPSPKTADASGIPQYQLPGNGNEISDLNNSEMQNLITTFFKAWAASDQTALVNITDKDSKESVYDGMNGQVVIDGNGDPSFKIYGPPSTDKYYRALVTVNWRENVGSGDAAGSYQQTSMYILKLKKQGDKFIVIDVQPYKYIPEQHNSSDGND